MYRVLNGTTYLSLYQSMTVTILNWRVWADHRECTCGCCRFLANHYELARVYVDAKLITVNSHVDICALIHSEISAKYPHREHVDLVLGLLDIYHSLCHLFLAESFENIFETSTKFHVFTILLHFSSRNRM